MIKRFCDFFKFNWDGNQAISYTTLIILSCGTKIVFDPLHETPDQGIFHKMEGGKEECRTKKFIIMLVLLLFLPFSAFADLQIHFLNVGQGDCTIVLCDDEVMVIDGGPRTSAAYVYSYIENTLELQHIDYMISTHPHLDHVYGLSSILNAAPVDLILTPVLEWDSKAFGYMLKYAEAQGTPIIIPQEGDTLQLGGATVTILHCWPEAIDYGRTNDSSIVVRIDYGKTSYIITGDAEDWSEYMMIDAGVNLKADVLRVAHHGSYNSSTMEFLLAVQPDYAVISVGRDNGYGHPHQVVLDRLKEINVVLFRTDMVGTIVCTSDGETISFDTVYESNGNPFQTVCD